MKHYILILVLFPLAYLLTACGSDDSTTTLKPASASVVTSNGSTAAPLPRGVIIGINLINGVNCEFIVKDVNTEKVTKYSGRCNTFQIGDSVSLGPFGNGSISPTLKNLE